MNKFGFVIAAIFLLVLFSVSAFAQIQTAPKIVLINTEAFYDEKAGITKLVTANKQLDAEFAAKIKALQDGAAKLPIIAKELENMRNLPPNLFNQGSFSAKQDEGERLQRELNYNKTELETAITKRRETLVAPISREIGKGIDEFSKKNGYGAIFDAAKLAESGVLLFLAESADVTKAFITFYNTRPATTATTVTPK